MRISAIIIFLFYTTFSSAQINRIELKPDANYPRWLNTDSSRTDQTSGITFIKSDSGKKYFLLADDIGKIHLLTIENDTLFNINTLEITDSAKSFVDILPKADFEEITFDPHTNSIYLSIEGNGNDFRKDVGIYKIYFNDNQFPYRQINYLEKLNFYPTELFLKYTDKNIGYEGFAVDENYFYLGLEGIVKNYQFADSTFIFIASKSDNTIIKSINTKTFGIHTVCGLFSDSNRSLWGIDRNQRKIFHFKFDDSLNVKDFASYDAKTNIPGYSNLHYNPSFESITFDDENNLYLIDDPWQKMFIPDKTVLDQLDKNTVNNFYNLIPIIFKYKLLMNERSPDSGRSY